MVYIVLGSLGFLIIHLLDIVSLRRIPWVKPWTWIPGCGLLGYSVIAACLSPEKFLVPLALTYLGWFLLSISLLLLIYSLFINLPFRKTYITTGVGNRLIRTGLYALVRHPGVHWFTVLILSLVLVSQSKLLLLAAPIWILLDILLVVIQDKFYLGKMFNKYDRYQRETPMLIPNKESVSAFLRTIHQTKPSIAKGGENDYRSSTI